MWVVGVSWELCELVKVLVVEVGIERPQDLGDTLAIRSTEVGSY